MMSLHQLRCFLATYELGSLTAAAEHLGYAQPSISEQIRTLEKSIDAKLFRRVGRGVVPTTVADSLRPHAERTLASAAEAQKAIESVTAMESGTIRFGMFGTARLYAGASLIADVLEAEISAVNTTEGAAVGAALLATPAAGWYPTVDAAVAAFVRSTPVASPGPDAPAYREAHGAYRDLYPALAPHFHRA